MEYLVGTGRWGYFNAGSKPSLKAYSEVFNFVEVNTTFYEYPNIRTVECWRRLVPDKFTFSVRCHQDLTHRIGFKPVDEAYEAFYKMKTYCQALDSSLLVLETPIGCAFDEKAIEDAERFFSTVSCGDLQLVWEYRAPFNSEVADLMADFAIIHCVDLSNELPILKDNLTYSRLFGKGKHNIYQFTDNELLDIDKRAKKSPAKKTILSFHGARMYSDAARFQVHAATGKFMQVTDFIGADSAKAVLSEDAHFPSSRTQLIKDQGWKVIDMTADKRIHLSEALNMIPDKTYSSIDELTKELKAVL